MGMFAAALLHLDVPQEDKRLLTIVETDGCAVDGITAVTGCSVGHRTLRVEDYGKIAAAFIDTESGRSVRIVPRSGIRQEALLFAPGGANRWEQQLLGYQRMPDDALFRAEEVSLTRSIRSIVSRAGQRKECGDCGEEIMNERWVVRDGAILCRGCAGPCYYERVGVPGTADALHSQTAER
jgi:formylmethanofuran dehydrogenase subunit E